MKAWTTAAVAACLFYGKLSIFYWIVVAESLTLTSIPGSSAASELRDSTDLSVRARPEAPGGYTPTTVSCPSIRPSARDASSVSSSERDWLHNLRSNTADALVDFFRHIDMHGFHAVGYIQKHKSNSSALPNVAIAVSGVGIAR